MYRKSHFKFSFFGAISFFALFFIFKKVISYFLEDNLIHIMSSKLVGNLHATLIVTTSAFYLIRKCSFATWEKVVYVTIGYLSYDIINYTYNLYVMTPFYDIGVFRIFIELYLHHLIMMGLLLLPLKKYGKTPVVALLAEISNPFLDICRYIHFSGQKTSQLFTVMVLCLLITFFLFRVVNFSALFAYMLIEKNKTFSRKIKYFSFLLLSMNYYWFFLICKKVMKHI